ncbi:MAG: VWA domain-containing protein [Meiothermus sp.]|nr:VWA domain-containing protein [Meiothermus sp.]
MVAPSPRVALLALEIAPARLLQRALKIQGLEVEIRPPDDAPKNLEGWAAYEAAILMNLPATRLTVEQQKALEVWVRDQGGGLLLLGGANSFGPGGYYRTALDRLSPLSSKIPQEAPKVAMLFVLDKSGSMNQPTGDGNTRRVEIAVQAILEAVRQFHPESLAGVVAFDAQAETVVPVQLVQNQGFFEARLSSVQTGGGTSLYPALVAAYQQMRGVDSLARHVVLLSDGLSDLGDFDGVVAQMARENINLSTVAIGEGADVALVERLARLGRGAAHVTTNWQALPGILAQEALLLSATPVKRAPFVPRWTDADHGLLEGWPDALPALGGYVLTTAKPAARLHLVGPEQAPVLASWRVGLGQVVAFTSQGVGAWADGWTGLPEFPRMWGQVIHQLLQPTARAGLNLQTRYRGDELELSLEAINPDSTPQTGLTLRAKLNTQAFALQEQTPGRYTASAIPEGAEVYGLEVGANTDPPQVVSTQVLPAAAARYAFGEGSEVLLGISQATGGRLLLSADNLFAPGTAFRWETRPAWPGLVLLGLLLFLAGLWVRYVPPVSARGRARTPLPGVTKVELRDADPKLP